MAGTLLDKVLDVPGVRADLAATREQPGKAGAFEEPNSPVHPQLAAALEGQRIERLYSHQARAYDAVMSGRDAMVVTGTNSGKTLCYALPTLQHCLTEPACRALMLFPTKALAQDQLGKLQALVPGGEVRAGVYDGDTPIAQRGPIRRTAHVILSNPDMLHVGILPGHENWAKFLKSLKLIVLDELHAYRGVFGSHVAGVMRRLLRLCEWHGARPAIVACSATIGNPLELFGKLTGRVPELIVEDGAPKGKRSIAFYNPPIDDTGSRHSSNMSAAGITANLVERGLRVLAFCRARVTAELVLRYTRERLAASGEVAAGKVESYRAGYTPKERREIEQALFRGDILALACTNAMELGVDVGGLDAVVLNGYPGTVASFWQQAGRAGRGTRDGLVLYVAQDDPLDQFFMREPEMLLEATHEPVSINPENRTILEQQLRCAAYERPIAASELPAFGECALELIEQMERSGELELRSGRFFYPSYEAPAPRINIRGVGSEAFTLIANGQLLGTMERWRALQFAHQGAVYLHRGASYVVRSLDLEAGEVHLAEESVPYYTQAVVQSVIEPLVTLRQGGWGAYSGVLGSIRVTESVIGFRRKSLDGETILSVEPLDLPPLTYETVGIRLSLPEIDVEEAAREVAAVHGVEHALAAVAPFFAGCDRGDLGSAWYASFPRTAPSSFSRRGPGIHQGDGPESEEGVGGGEGSPSSFSRRGPGTHQGDGPENEEGVGGGDSGEMLGGPAIFVYDHVPGGVGLAEKLFEMRGAWANAALRLLASCPCADGCPACLLSARCESNNDALSKKGAVSRLRDLCGGI